MRIHLTVELGYNATLGGLHDALEQAHLAGFTDRDCRVVWSDKGHLQITRNVETEVQA